MRILPLGLTLALLAGCAQPASVPAPAPPPGFSHGQPRVASTAASIEVRTQDGVHLTGLVTMPRQAQGPVPVALFIEGAGAWDADYAAVLPSGRRFQVLPLPELAEACASAGIAFVRYAKRGAADPADWRTSSLEHLLADARAMQAAVRQDRRFDARRLAVVGHSEGTAIAAWTAQEARAIALLSVVRRNLQAIGHDMAVDGEVPITLRTFDRSHDGLLDQAELEAALKTSKGAGLAAWRDFDADRDGALGPREITATYEARFKGFVTSLPGLDPTALLTPTRWLGPAPAAWWRQHFARRPAGEAWQGTRTPLLVLHGEADPVTPYDTEAAPLAAQLAAEQHPDHRLIGFPGLDHSFRDAQGATQAARVFAELVPWLKAHLAG